MADFTSIVPNPVDPTAESNRRKYNFSYPATQADSSSGGGYGRHGSATIVPAILGAAVRMCPHGVKDI
jgi:hypothetical protein